MHKVTKIYQILFFVLLSVNIAMVCVVLGLWISGYFTNSYGFCKIIEGSVEVCKQITQNSCKDQDGEFFFDSKDCKTKAFF